MTNKIEPWYDLRSALPTAVGTALLEMAANAQGHPADTEYDEWIEALKIHGAALRAFGELDASGEDPSEEKAQDALKWVAANLLRLWD